MTNILMAVFLAVIAGMAVSIQAPLSSILNQQIGQIESVFIVHLGGTVAAGIILLVIGGGNMRAWRNAPWYTYLAGLLGLVVIASINIAIVRMGSIATVSIMFASQLALGGLLDHFGWLGLEVRPLTLPRLLGMVVMGFGAWLTIR
jgi:bacterial/archaeal transporter family-2 protein